MYTYATTLCARSEQCPQEVRRKLMQRGATPEQADDLVARLVSEGYIDEMRYASAYVHDKLRFDRWGRVKIVTMLRSKGLSAAAIDAAWEEHYDAAAYRDALDALLAAKRRTLPPATTPEERRRASQSLMRYAASRGYEAHDIYAALGAPDDAADC